MLEIRGLHKKKGSFCLEDISFHLPKGYIMGLVGPNGAGKTTLIRLILGLYQPGKGTIKVNGMDILEHERKVKNEIGCVLNEEFFLSELSLEQNAAMYGKYYDKYDEMLFFQYCKRFHLNVKSKLKNQSRGEKLKFQMAFALAHQPRLLILDEPTANFDPEFRGEFLKVLSEFVASGENSVLLATHITEDLDQIGDYITVLNKGKLLCAMDRNTLEDKYRIAKGEAYKINLLKPEQIVGVEKGEYSTTALIHYSSYGKYDKEIELKTPSVEELLYFMVKEG